MPSLHRRTIPPDFIINLYLDTNNLIYMIDGNIKSLTYAINFIKGCDFITLSSSQYAFIEFLQNRRIEHYYRFLVKSKNVNIGSFVKYKREFNSPELPYEDIKLKLKKLIEKDLDKLINDFNINPNDYSLNDKLYELIVILCLNSRVSMQDSVILGSSLLPTNNRQNRNTDCILTNDKQFSDEYTQLANITREISDCINDTNFKLPILEWQKKLSLLNSADTFDLNKVQKKRVVIDFMKKKIIEWIVMKNNKNYLGKLFFCPSSNQDVVCFYLEKNVVLPKGVTFVILDRDLKRIYINKTPVTEFRNSKGNTIKNLPYSNKKSKVKLSFKWTDNCSNNTKRKLKQANNLLFIHPDV